MPADSLFAKEEAVVAEGEARLAAGSADPAAYRVLLDDYGKLLRTARRMMRLSDRNERELSAMAERQRLASEEVDRKNRELEALSSKLAKYLSPQVYASIFAGREEVRLASRRKKLTVFFSDIAGFTELTEKMESEDLTLLLNQYLTEMSRVALAHGATIDKYVGDGIMIFFGDPETQGVREDAVACVRMALAMQERLAALKRQWQDQGLPDSLACRIGISTGFCTVGNFGSDDRMDYTIIGGPVNVASRLEHEAGPGEIFVSYETRAHVRHAVRCEAVGPIRVKGVAHPVPVWRVLGAAADPDAAGPLIAELPHFRLALDPAALDPDERGEVERLLATALAAVRGDA